MDLRSLGKLAFDLHISQDSKSLSAVEDVFYLLSDRRPCLVRRIPLSYVTLCYVTCSIQQGSGTPLGANNTLLLGMHILSVTH
jgi:hypothetical protein